MSLLAKRFREIVGKSKDKMMSMEASANVCYSTGFIALDFLNGMIVHVDDEERNIHEKYYSVGIQDGTINQFIGRSSCGKTTFAMQCAFNIVNQFDNACFYHDDVENGINDSRKRVLTGIPLKVLKQKYIARDTGVTTENFYERIKTISDEKLNNYDDYSYDTGLLDESGDPIIKLQPTVYLLDSFAMLMPEKFATEDEMSGQMAGPATARMNTAMLRRIVPLLKASNIILFIINHILPDVSLLPKKGQLRCLKQGERLPGGETLVYLTTNIFRFDDTKLKEKDGLGFNGALINISLPKSRQNYLDEAVTMVFNPITGYDPVNSLLLLLKNKGKINGGGIGMYLGDRKDMKFSQKKFKEKFNTDQEFQDLVMEEVMDVVTGFIKDVNSQSENMIPDFNKNFMSKVNDRLKVKA